MPRGGHAFTEGAGPVGPAGPVRWCFGQWDHPLKPQLTNQRDDPPGGAEHFVVNGIFDVCSLLNVLTGIQINVL